MKKILMFVVLLLLVYTVNVMGQDQTFFDYKAKAENGDGYAQGQVSCAYFFGNWGVTKNPSEAFLWALKSDMTHDEFGEYMLGLCYFNAVGTSRDYYKAASQFEKSFQHRERGAGAAYYLAYCYYYGMGKNKDMNKALYYFEKSIEYGELGGQSVVDDAQNKIQELRKKATPYNNETTIALLSATITSSTSYELRVGIKSPSQIRDKYVYVNGSLQRAIDVVKNDGFDMEIGQDVSLHEGNNTIRIEIINASGTTSKEFVVYVSTSTHSISHSEKRIALVVGISNYRNTSRLRNTINDANAMESKLRQCGFTVIKRTDLQTASEIQNVINEFGAQARNGYDVALFFYAGHGINYNNESWIVPTLASIQCAEQIPNVCANAGWIMDATSGVKNRIVIFDACRNLPGIKDCNNASRDIEGHITPGITSFRKGGGAFVAYACSQGETSGDGPIGGNGIYTGELLKMLDKPNMNILDVFSETATNVHNKTNATQNPWNTSAFYGKFIFNRQ